MIINSYIFFLGVLTSMIEAFLDIPLIYELYISKNSNTISYLLIFGWLSGDIFKVSYYCSRNTPIQLVICAIFQLSTDFIVIYQIYYYNQQLQENIDKFFRFSHFKINDNIFDRLSNIQTYSRNNDSDFHLQRDSNNNGNTV